MEKRGPYITKENAKENQVKSVEKRKANRLAREVMREDLERQLLAEKGKKIKSINKTAIELAETGEDKSRNYVAKTIGLYENDEQQTGATINININGCIEKKEDVDELV